MNKEIAIILNLYVVPLSAVLLSLFGYLQGGTGLVTLDIIIYNIIISLGYSMIYLFRNLYKNNLKGVISIIVYLILIVLFTYFINYVLLVFLPIILLHLIFFTKHAEKELDFDKSVISFVIECLPKTNWILLIGYFTLTIIISR